MTATTAVLQTAVNALGHDTTFYFQYGTDSCKEDPASCTSVPTPPGRDLGAGEIEVFGSEPASELKPDTVYHYRVLAHNELGTSEGAEHTFTTQPAPAAFALPDDRAWEMVTPPSKQSPVEPLTREGAVILAAEDGDALTYVVDGALGEEAQGNRTPEPQQIIATRGASGWISQDIALPSGKADGISPGATPEYQFFTPDLATTLVQPPGAEPPLAPGVAQATIYLRDDAVGSYLPLVTEANVAPGTKFASQIHFVGASPDLSHVVIASGVPLEGSGSAPGLYEWTDGELQLVSVLPGGAPVTGTVELGYSHTVANTVLDDGTRIIWTTPEEEPHLGHLYMRDTVTHETVQLDAAQGVAEPKVVGSARFETASSEGSRVFFTDRQRFTPDSTAEADSEQGPTCTSAKWSCGTANWHAISRT